MHFRDAPHPNDSVIVMYSYEIAKNRMLITNKVPLLLSSVKPTIIKSLSAFYLAANKPRIPLSTRAATGFTTAYPVMRRKATYTKQIVITIYILYGIWQLGGWNMLYK